MTKIDFSISVSIYIPVHNYGKYLEQAIESVIAQKFNDWELIIIDDGSTDNSWEIIKKYSLHPKIRTMHQEKKGLPTTNNIALRLSQGKYIMRLDADDYLDENALLVLSNILETNPQVGLVFPDYYLIDEQGEIVEIVRREKIGQEVELLDLPALGACTMIRKECLLEVGGYREEFQCQDGYELWLKFIESFNPYNVNIPLFYYRQHPSNLSKNMSRILKARGFIKRTFVENSRRNAVPKILVVIPVLKKALSALDSALHPLAGKPLLWYTISEALKTSMLDKIAVSSDDTAVLDYCRAFPQITPILRPKELSNNSSDMGAIIMHVLEVFNKENKYAPDAVMILYSNTPLRRSSHIQKCIDTMIIFNVDSVVAVNEEVDHFYNHKRYGLCVINKRAGITLERDALYRDNGSIYLSRTSAITRKNFLGESIGHIVMLPEESIRIRSNYDFWLAEKILNDWRKVRRDE
jgi:glycosyltransferase involved in cell wall biosynthesis